MCVGNVLELENQIGQEEDAKVSPGISPSSRVQQAVEGKEKRFQFGISPGYNGHNGHQKSQTFSMADFMRYMASRHGKRVVPSIEESQGNAKRFSFGMAPGHGHMQSGNAKPSNGFANFWEQLQKWLRTRGKRDMQNGDSDGGIFQDYNDNSSD